MQNRNEGSEGVRREMELQELRAERAMLPFCRQRSPEDRAEEEAGLTHKPRSLGAVPQNLSNYWWAVASRLDIAT